jgi:hypothetical protein
MTTGIVDQLVSDYLTKLDRAAATLPAHRRTELLDEIREHIDAARAAGAAADEATVRTMLDRLGEPEEIVAAASDDKGPPPATAPTRPGTGLEIAAVLLLTVGSFIPLIGWAVGAILLWTSRRWTTRDKLLGTLVIPGGPAMPLWLGPLATQSCTESMSPSGVVEEDCTGFALPPWIVVPLFVAALIAPFIVAGILLSRARARAALEPPVIRPIRRGAARGAPDELPLD